ALLSTATVQPSCCLAIFLATHAIGSGSVAQPPKKLHASGGAVVAPGVQAPNAPPATVSSQVRVPTLHVPLSSAKHGPSPNRAPSQPSSRPSHSSGPGPPG